MGFFLPQEIILRLDGGALASTASVNGQAQFSVILDTGSPLTVWDDHSGITSLQTGLFRLNDAAGVPRLELQEVRFYATELRSLGVAGFPVGGVLGGDNLQRWVLGLDYRTTPKLTVFDHLTPCDCELANQGQAAMRFALAGGGSDRQLSVGGDVLAYPATRVLIEACLEPSPDPLSAGSDGIKCTGRENVNLNGHYLPSGADARLIVATGFPGFAISASMFDRLRGPGSAAAVLANPTFLHLPDQPDDGPAATGLAVGRTMLGRAEAAALVLVARQGYLGACAEVARSRRQRRNPPGAPRPGEEGCFLTDACNGGGQSEDCNDLDSHRVSYVSPMLEFDQPIPTYVVPDTAPILVGINADVRPASATVDGIVGTEILQRLVGYIDYPRRRFSMRCVEGAGCLTYPTFVDADHWPADCDPQLCQRPSQIPPNGGLSTPLPP